MTSWQDLVARLTSECSRKLYGQCSVRSCLLNGGWEPNDGSGYSKAACQEWEAGALIERQAREIERLREALKACVSRIQVDMDSLADAAGYAIEVPHALKLARAALQENTDGR